MTIWSGLARAFAFLRFSKPKRIPAGEKSLWTFCDTLSKDIIKLRDKDLQKTCQISALERQVWELQPHTPEELIEHNRTQLSKFTDLAPKVVPQQETADAK